MKIEEVIKQLESILDHTRSMAAEADADGIWKEDIAALEFALTALRSMPEAGEPLSLEQLKVMHGQWVWIVSPDADMTVSAWAYVGENQVFTYWEYKPDKLVGRVVYNICDYGDWLAYSYPPAHIDRRAWTAEWVPTTDDDGCVWLECSACEYDLDSMEESNPFCPSCGRAMTEEAWTELERRLRG